MHRGKATQSIKYPKSEKKKISKIRNVIHSEAKFG